MPVRLRTHGGAGGSAARGGRAAAVTEPAIFREAALTPTTLAQRLIALASLEPLCDPDAPIGDHGGVYQSERIATLAEWCCATQPGNLCEIGCYAGETTVRLAVVARKHGRLVAAIDNYAAGTPYNLAEEVLPGFVERIAPWPEIKFQRIDANDPNNATAIRVWGPFGLSFIDANKEHEDVRNQLAAVMPVTTGIIAVDDAYVTCDILRACDEMARESHGMWKHLRYSAVRETYLVRQP